MARAAWRRVDGVLLLDKPLGLTSNAALQSVRRLYGAAKAGHGGTLDPLATGLLPILFGEATKFGGALLDADKTYEALIALGVTTATGDAEGSVIERRNVAATELAVKDVLSRFQGAIAQTPPMYSALKRDGRPLYAYARAGQSIERLPRTVTIHELRLNAFELGHVDITVRCSKGTYIRTLAEDIGQALGCGAHLAALRRTAIGAFGLADARKLEELESSEPEGRDARLRPVDVLLAELPAVRLDAGAAGRFVQGQPVEVGGIRGGKARVYEDGAHFLGIGEVNDSGQLRPLRLLQQRPADTLSSL
jgi:tRNA pseudouridine55 synthase